MPRLSSRVNTSGGNVLSTPVDARYDLRPDRFQEIFANVRARYDAENRAATTVAESIKTRIAAYLAEAPLPVDTIGAIAPGTPRTE